MIGARLELLSSLRCRVERKLRRTNICTRVSRLATDERRAISTSATSKKPQDVDDLKRGDIDRSHEPVP
jgi:hypothetical protein